MNILTKIGLMLGGAFALHSVMNKSLANGIPPQEPGIPPYYPPPVVPATPAPTSSTPVVSGGYPAGTFPMARGSRSAHVAKLQAKLGFVGRDADGIFGIKTETALKAKYGVIRIANSVDYERIMTTGKSTPAPTTPVPAAPTSENVVVRKGEMNTVFNALFKPVDRVPNTFQYQTFVEQNVILDVLENKSDLYLVHFANYWKGGTWKAFIFFGTAKAARFIRNDLEKGQADFLRTDRYKALIARFKRLNIA